MHLTAGGVGGGAVISHASLSLSWIFFPLMLPKTRANKETSGGADKLAVSGRSDEPSGADGTGSAAAAVSVDTRRGRSPPPSHAQGSGRPELLPVCVPLTCGGSENILLAPGKRALIIALA